MIIGANLTQLNPYINSFCKDAIPYSDVDGDTEVRCDYNDKCPYQRVVRDCDGDIIIMCDRY